MAFDGITIAAMVSELNKNLSGGRINKIAQPESDELLITGKGANGQKRLLLSASASLPLIYFTGKNRISPLTAPNFCMLLRKHIGSARITAIRQPGLERVVEFELEHLNELGDVCHKVLIMELMGKHSNIIFCDDNNMILDSIKHVSCNVSSVREVLPGRPYFIPHTQDKLDPLTISREDFMEKVCGRSNAVSKALYQTLTGFSPVMAQELCYRASIDGNDDVQTLDENTREQLYTEFTRLMEQIRREEFTPVIVFKGDEPVEYGVLPFSQYGEGFTTRTFESVSEMLETYYASRDVITRIRQKSADLRKIVQTVKSYAAKFGTEIPVVAAGGIATHEDVKHVLDLGVDGVQVATRFIPTEECDADIRLKESLIHAAKDDIAIVKSPVGMPGRAIMNSFMQHVMAGEKIPHSPCHRCLAKCSPGEIPYCITDKLIAAVKGDVENGLLFCGAKAYMADKIETVHDVIADLFGTESECIRLS